jgi:ribonuclease PH
MNALFEKVRLLEETPKVKIYSKIEFIKKALLAGLTVLITGAVLGLGSFIWKLINNLDTIIQAIDNLNR